QSLAVRESGSVRLEEAVASYRNALEVFTRDRAPLQWANSLSNLGGLLRDQGDLAGALQLFERARATYEEILGTDHPSTAASFHSLAEVFEAQGDLPSA